MSIAAPVRHATVEDDRWTILAALVWILKHDEAKAMAHIEQVIAEKAAIAQDMPTIAAARSLVEAFRSGDLICKGRAQYAGARLRTISTAEWRHRVIVLDKGRWVSQWPSSLSPRGLRRANRLGRIPPTYSDLVVSRAAVMDVWPVKAGVRPAHRPNIVGSATRNALKKLYPPHGDPGDDEEKRESILAAVNEQLRGSGLPEIKRDTLRRAIRDNRAGL